MDGRVIVIKVRIFNRRRTAFSEVILTESRVLNAELVDNIIKTYEIPVV